VKGSQENLNYKYMKYFKLVCGAETCTV